MITVLFVIAFVGVGLYLVNAVFPMDPKIKLIFNVVSVVGLLVWLASVFGIIGSIPQLRGLR